MSIKKSVKKFFSINMTIIFMSLILQVSLFAPKNVYASTSPQISYTNFKSSCFTAAAYGNNTYVAVGIKGSTAVSSDALTWTYSTPNDSFNFSDVTFGKNLFVAVGENGTIKTSSDGTNWTSQSSGTSAYLDKIIYTGTEFYTVGYSTNTTVTPSTYSGVVLKSSDGINWTPVDIGAADKQIDSIAYGNSIITITDYTGNIYCSSNNGSSWSKVANIGDTINFITFLHDRFYIGTTSAYLYYSSNASTWTNIGYPFSSVSSGAGAQPFCGLYDGSKYYFFGSNSGYYGGVITSTDGTSFTVENNKNSTMITRGCLYANGKYIQCGDQGIRVSTDGVNWEYATAVGKFCSTIFDGSNYISVGDASISTGATTFSTSNDGTIYKSSDFSHWTMCDIPLIKTLKSIAYGKGKYVAVGAPSNNINGEIVTSSDSENWSVSSSPNTEGSGGLTSVVYANNLFVAVGGKGSIITSPDGNSWTSVHSGSSYNLNFVDYINGQFVACGNGGKVLYSIDGSNWTENTFTDTTVIFYGVAYGNNEYVLVGSKSGKALSTTSSDLSTFSAEQTDTNFSYYKGVKYQDGSFVAITNALSNSSQNPNEAYLAVSSDGTNWTENDCGFSKILYGINYINGSFRVAGYDGLALSANLPSNASYTVNYDGNGNTSGAVPTDSTGYTGGTSVTAKDSGDLAKTNYTFAGWNTAQDGTGTAVAAGGNFSISKNTTLYAQWTARKIITTIPGGGNAVNGPEGVGIDRRGNVYIADTGNNVVRRVDAIGNVTIIAGTGTAGYTGDGGLARNATLNNPSAVAVDNIGNIYIADSTNNVIRKIDTNGNISTIAGTGTAGYAGDGGPAKSAELNNPMGLAVDGSGNIYISDSNNNEIRKIDANGNISTIAGTYMGGGYTGDGGKAVNAKICIPNSLALDSNNNLYIAEAGNNAIRKIDTSGNISTIAGKGPDLTGYTGDGGPATNAQLNTPDGVFVDSSGNIYIADSGNNVIREIGTNGNISTIAGKGPDLAGYTGDGGDAKSAQLSWPDGIVVSSSGNAYVADNGNNAIRKISSAVSSYTVTYDGNGNTSGAAPTDNNGYTDGTSVTAKDSGDVAKTDYTFAGWNTAQDGTGTAVAAGGNFNISENVTLYAQWTANAPVTASGLTVTTTAETPAVSGKVNLIVSPAAEDSDHKVYYKIVDSDPKALNVGDAITLLGWTEVTDGNAHEITVPNGKYIEAVEVTTADSKVTKWGKSGATDDGYIPSASLNTNTASFDKNVSNQADVSVIMAPNGNTLMNITNGGTPLVSGKDYTASGNTITISKDYLASLAAGTTANIVFNFNGGSPQSLSVTILDTTPRNSSLSINTANFDKNTANQADINVGMTLNGNTLTSIVYGVTPLVKGIDYTVNGNTVTINKSYLVTLGTGTTALVFNFSAGNPQNLGVTVTDTTPVAASGLTVTTAAETPAVSGKVNLIVSPAAEDSDHKVYYKVVDSDPTALNVGDAITLLGWTEVTDGNAHEITVPNGKYIEAVGVTTADSKVTKWGKSGATDDGYIPSASLNTNTASFDKNVSNQADVSVIMAPNGNTLMNITNGGTPLVSGKDYTASGNTITISKDYLASLAAGTTANIVFNFNGGSPQNLSISIMDTTPIAASGLTVAAAAESTPVQGKVNLAVTPGVEDSNHKVYYKVVDSAPTALNVGDAITLLQWTEVTDANAHEITVPNGKYIEAVEVTTADNKVTKWGKSNATNDGYIPSASLSTNTASFDKNTANQADVNVGMTLNGNTLTSIVYGVTPLVSGIDYTVNGNTVTINKGYLATLGTGTAALVFNFSAGNSQSLNVTVADTTPVAASGLTVTAASESIPVSGKVNLTVIPGAEDGNHKVYYKVVDSVPTALNVGDVITQSEWTEVTDANAHEITVPNGKYIEAVEVTTADNKVTKWGKSGATNDGYIPSVKLNTNTASFDKNTANQADVNVSMGLAEYELANITGNSLLNGTDYTISGNTVSIKKSSLGKLITGTSTVLFNSVIGNSQDLTASISVNQSDVDLTMALNGKSLTSITNEGNTLVNGTDYIVNGNTVAIKRGFLTKLGTGTANLVFNFGTENLAVTMSANQTDLNATMTLNENALTSITNGINTLVKGIDYSVSGNAVTINKSYLETLSTGTAALVFNFSTGSPQNLNVTVTDTTPIAASGLTVTTAAETTAVSGKVNLTVAPAAQDGGHKVYYKVVDSAPTALNVGDVITLIDWTEVTDANAHEITVPNGKYIEAVEVTTGDNKVTKWGKSGATNDGYIPSASLSTNTASFDKNVSNQADINVGTTLNGNTLTSITNGGIPLVNGTDYTVIGNVVTINKSYLSSLTKGTTANLVFNFNGGSPQSLNVTVTDTTAYTVTFKDYDGSTIGTPQTVNYGGNASAPENPTRAGYTFTGWDKAFDNVTGNLVVTAQYSINKYTVTFQDYNGNTIGTPQTVNYGEKASAPGNPTRTGYTFAGWDKAFDNITGNLVVTAQYLINKYTVTFQDYNGNTIGTPQTVNYGEKASAPANPTRTGYTFTGWDKAFDNVTGNLVVTAQYSINKYKVTFQDYNGNTIGTPQTVNYGEKASAPGNPTRTGYTFTGWDKAFDNVTGNLVVTAQYSIDRYTVTFKNYDGSTIGTPQTVNYGEKASAPGNPARAGYNFVGWDKAFDNITGNLVVTAQYSINKYTVTFKDYDGSAIGMPQTVNYGGKALAPGNPTRTGYVFAGWDKAFDNVTGNLVVTATYTSGNTYDFPSNTSSSADGDETKISTDYLKSRDNTLVINNNTADLSIPAKAIDLTDGGDHIKVTEKVVTSTSNNNTLALFSSVPNGVQMVGDPLSLNIQLFDVNDNLIKDIHQFANNEKVKVTIKLTADQVKGIDTSKLSMYYYDETNKEWIELGGTFDPNSMEFTFYTSHFTNFAIMQKVTAASTSTNINTNANSNSTIKAVSNNASSEKELPKTGSIFDFNTLLGIGIVLIASGIAIFRRRKNS